MSVFLCLCRQFISVSYSLKKQNIFILINSHTMAKYDGIKELLKNYFEKNAKLGRSHIFERLLNLGAPKRSLHRWLNLLFDKKNLERKPGSDRKKKIATPATIRIVKQYFNNRSGRSENKLASRLKTSQPQE